MDCIDCCASGANPDDSILQSRRRKQALHAAVDPYQVLELRRDATDTEIVRSYKKLALWHHPGRGRGKEPAEETQRRWMFFQILSNCYETLIHKESRRKFDVQMKRLERKRLAGTAKNTVSAATSKELLPRSSISGISTQKSGGRRSRLNTGTSLSSNHHVLVHQEEGVPALTKSSSTEESHPSSRNMEASSSSTSTMIAAPGLGFFCAPQLIQDPSGKNSNEITDSSKTLEVGNNSSTSRSTSAEEPEMHFTEATVNRLFGGPLAPLHQARNFEPFTDPFVIFEKVFGNPVFPRVTQQDLVENSTTLTTTTQISSSNQLALCHGHKPSGWTGSAHKDPDGLTTVFVSSRIFHDRKITRTETVHLDPETGQARSEVTVDAEQYVVEPVEKEQGKCGGASEWILCHRGGGADNSIKEIEQPTGDEDHDTQKYCLPSVYGNAMDEFYDWNRELYGACTSYMGCTDGAIE
ncbi:MAG: hypothetical protein SGARI_003151 [Bacillariaceae sp.]